MANDKNIAYYEVNDGGFEFPQIFVVTKTYWDENHCFDDREQSDEPIGKAFAKIGLCEAAESMFELAYEEDGEFKQMTVEDMVSKMAKQGWQMLPLPTDVAFEDSEDGEVYTKDTEWRRMWDEPGEC